jgi:cyclopropane fatty-acyl-phospholipid synthase-like methyltransferase
VAADKWMGWHGMGRTARAASWTSFFDQLRDDSPLYREQAAIYVSRLATTVQLDSTQRVLDFGCGFGYVATLLAPLVGELWLWDASSAMRTEAARNTAPHRNVRILDLSSTDRTPAESGRLDLILVNSVIQYMSRKDLSGWLVRWRGMLPPGGQVVASDLIPARSNLLSDPVDLIRLAARHQSPLRVAAHALGGLVSYWSVARAVPLSRVSVDDFTGRGAEAGFDTVVLPSNLTHFRRRWAAVLTARS